VAFKEGRVRWREQQKAKQFYLSLGFELIMEAPSSHGETWIQLGLPGSATTISLAKFHGIIIETNNIEEKIKSLDKVGVTVGKIDSTPWGRFAWLKDLDGNGLCLHEK
jgi:hypothetical protein